MSRFDIITVGGPDGFQRQKFFLDCPLDVELHRPEVRRIEIPRELAVYIDSLQRRIRALEQRNE